MFEVKNSIDWKTAKSYFDNCSYDVYYDTDNYNRMLVFEANTEGISDYIDELFGGDWRWMDSSDIEMLEKHCEALNRIEMLADLLPKSDVYISDEIPANIEELKLRYIPATISFEALGDTEVNMRGLTNHSYQSDLVLTTFPEHLRMFLSGFSDLLNAKNKAYGNSALEPINVFSKASSSDVILQQIDHKLSRLKTSDTPSKNDVIDLMGYLTLYCLDQSWLDLQDLHK